MISILQPVSKERAKQMNPVVLAFVGDAAYTLYVRQNLALSSACKTGELNLRASAIVSAHGQSGAIERILPRLTEDEAEVYRRGRNAKKPTKSKHATSAEYSRSTGLEAVVGYLYLTGEIGRIGELFFGEEV
ncbi:MAG: Mini-ribonuclease 3 [Candidatus Gallimonas sp.]